MRILLIEDDLTIGHSLIKGFTEAGYVCDWMQDGRTGAAAAQSKRYHVIVLDQMLPHLNGIDLLLGMRRTGNMTPVVLLTAVGSPEARVIGLNSGADDYLCKPFDFFELLARMNAVIRRSTVHSSPMLMANGLALDLTSRRVSRDGEDLPVSPIEFSVLELLMRYSGQLVTRAMLCEHIWGFLWEGTTNVIEVHINRLRGKIDQPGVESIIKTVRGRGYSIPAVGVEIEGPAMERSVE